MNARLFAILSCLLLLVPCLVCAEEAEEKLEVIEIDGPVPVRGPVEAVIKALVPTSGTKPAAAPAKPDDKKKPADEEEAPEPAQPKAPENPREFKFSLRDGSMITGELTLDQIVVETEFGPLTIPVAKVRSFIPGLNASPELAKKITDLVEALGGDDYKAREQAHKDLAKMGASVRKELEAKAKDENAERRRHIGDLLKELDQQDEERDPNEDGPSTGPLIRGDTVVTPEFTVVGKIATQQFKVNTKFGELALNLGDLRRGEKGEQGREDIRRSVTVEGTNLVQLGFKSSGVKVEKGDRITLKADGNLVMTPWGNETQSTPDGGANFGWYIPNQIPGGSLVVRIGASGKVTKAGSSKTWVAENSGVLEFAVAMQQQYANQGYAFPGSYNVKLKIEPK